jgi:23S rRNA pseudouridine1911/1915/1917 synthase
MRLDLFLVTTDPTHSRTQWQKWIKKGHVQVDGHVIMDPGHIVRPNPVIRTVDCVVNTVPVLAPCPMALDIVYEDDTLLVVNKPAGLVVHPGAGTGHTPTLVHGLLAHCGPALSTGSGHSKPGIVHRLDKDTSGLMVVAKTDEAHRHLSHQFEQRTVEKNYWAFVWGCPTPPVGRMEDQLGRCPVHRQKQAVLTVQGGVHGRYARTDYRVVHSHNGVSMVECRLHTGRTHQVRVQWAHRHHPLIADAVYGRAYAPTVAGCTRHALHAYALRLTHPITGQPMAWSCPLPDDLMAVYKHVCP